MWSHLTAREARKGRLAMYQVRLKKKNFNSQLVFITSGENTKVIIHISCLQGYHRFGERRQMSIKLATNMAVRTQKNNLKRYFSNFNT